MFEQKGFQVEKRAFKILLAGGGTAGPVSPLLAVAKKIQNEYGAQEAEFLFVGTKNGPERKIVENAGLAFTAIPAGKLRRYFSFRNFFAPFEIFAGFIKSFLIIRKFEPDVIFGAGGFVCVPVMFAGWISGKKIMLHQQDVLPSLTNKI